jgi:tetratricopeptide (TPR) repeat protein
MEGRTKDMDRKIYLKKKKVSLGCGSTAKATVIEDYYQVTEVDEARVEIQLLNMDDHPFGSASIISRESLKDYVCCPDYFKERKDARQQAVEKHVRLGHAHYENKEFYSAEHEYDQALFIDPNHLRANLGKGKTLNARGEKTLARKAFSELSQMEALFAAENKHTFNELGIELRKEGLFEDALSNYRKALSIDSGDEVLHYNMGRVHYELGNRSEAIEELQKALSLKPDFCKAQEFLGMIGNP